MTSYLLEYLPILIFIIIGLGIAVSNPFVGDNSGVLSGANDYCDYVGFETYTGSWLCGYYVNQPGLTWLDTFEQGQSEYSGIDLLITSLGQECGNGNVEGSYSGTIYGTDNPALFYNLSGLYDIPVNIEFVFSVPRIPYM